MYQNKYNEHTPRKHEMRLSREWLVTVGTDRVTGPLLGIDVADFLDSQDCSAAATIPSLGSMLGSNPWLF